MSSETTRFESLLEAVPDALVGMDQEGVIRFVNRQTESLFGYDRDELIGQRIETLVPERLWQIYADHRLSYFADPRTRSSGLDLELGGRHRDGTEFPVNVSLSHIDTGDVLLVITAVSDVTQQKRAVKTAQLTAAVVEYSDDAIIGSTLEGVVTSWNPAAERMYGYSSEQIIGRYAGVLSSGDEAGEMRANLARIRAGQPVEQLETIRVRKDGTTVPVSVTFAPMRDDDGAIVGVSAVHRDVTEQRRSFEAAQRMAAIVENSDDAILSKTIEGIITSWNPAAERMYGYSSEEVVGRPVDLLSPQGRLGEIHAILGNIKAGQPVEHLQTIRVRKDGTVLPVSLTVSPIRGADGTVVGASTIARDLTEQEHAALYTRSLIETDVDPLVTISPEGKINDVNEAAVKVTGVTRAELIGSDYSQYLTEPDKAIEFFEQVFVQGSVTDFPLTVRHRDGTLTDVLCNASVYRDLGGMVVGVLATGRDVTLRKEALATAQRMAAIVKSSDDAIFAITLEGIITSWNPAAEKQYGYTSEEIIGKSAETISPTDRLDEIKAILAKNRANQHIEHLHTIGLRKDGTVFPVSLTVSPIRGPDDAIVGTSMISRNMSALHHAVLYSRSLIEAGLDPLVTISPAGRIDDVNEATVNVTGVSREELIGTDFSQYFTDPDKAHEGYARAFAQGSLTDYPLTLVHRDGTLTDVLYNASVYRDFNENVLGVLAVAREASMLRQQQQLSVQLQEALKSRVVIEQAKGITAQRLGVSIDQAYQAIRAHTRNNNASLRTVAEAIVEVGLQV
jgi:PAS domain S-box-containing protein